MRKFLVAILIYSLFGGADYSFAAQTIKAGSTCKKAGESKTYLGIRYLCAKNGKKLQWRESSAIAKPASQEASKTISQPEEKTSAQSQLEISGLGSVVAPPSEVISIYSGPKPVANKNLKKSFEVKNSLAPAAPTSNVKFWIFDPENTSVALGAPGLFMQKDGGDWIFHGTNRSDGGFDARLETGSYLIDVVEPKGNSQKYERGRYSLSVDSSGNASVEGLLPNSAGYFTVTAIVRGANRADKPIFVPKNRCQVLDQTGSTNMSNGFLRASGRLPNKGVVRALIIPVEFSDLKGSGSPATVYAEMAKGTADFYYKQSQKTLRFEFTTLPKYLNLNVSVKTFNLGSYNSGNPDAYFSAGLKAVENILDISDFDIAYVLPPSSVRPDQIAYGPAFPGSIDSNNYSNSTGRVLNGAVGGADAWQGLPGAGWKWMAHETGHTFGLYDWYTLDGTNPYGPWDLMSLNWSTEAIELNAWNRYISGWFEESQVTCVDQTDLADAKTITLEAIGVDSKNVKSAMVRISESRILVTEVRATAGLDVLKQNQTGVLVYVVDTSIPSIKGIATTYSRSNVDQSLRDAPLKLGESISVQGVKVKVTSQTGTKFGVTLSK
jgi:hypothetical protein